MIKSMTGYGKCEKQTDNLMRRTCFHGIGKYLGKSMQDKAITYCGQIKESDIKKSCYHGAGWGVSEISDSGKAVSYCKKIKSNFTDNCLVGVAWQISKTNNELSKKICENVINKVAKTKCLNF